MREFCINAKMKAYSMDQTILGDGIGMPGSVYFVLKGKVRVIENLVVTTTMVSGVKKYKLHKPSLQNIALEEVSRASSTSSAKEMRTASITSKRLSQQLIKKHMSTAA